ncbi:MAG: phosphoglycerate mutase family protein, partial [Pseudomonadota bacterium]
MVEHERRLFLVRHGPTDWNAAHRIQGHTDVALSALGRETVKRRRLDSQHARAHWFTSPLK